MIANQDFVILSTQDWDALPTRKHRFARRWAQQGNRVLYIEQQMHWAGWLADIGNQFSRAWSFLESPQEVEPNLWVYTLPLVLPFFQMVAAINTVNNAFLLPVIKRQTARLGFHHPILWAYTPHSADFIGRLGERLAVYECVDDFTASKGLVHPATIGRLEERLIRRVDLLITTAPALHDHKSDHAKRAVLVPNGVDADHFAQAADDLQPVPAAMRDLPRPVIGFLGSLNYWIDTGLLGRIAREHPDWTVAHVGPVDMLADMSPLQGLPNVALIGRVPYAQVPDYVRAFDVCVNPYHLDGVAEHCSPLKLYEYIATGKPVVSVDMPEARQFDGLIAISQDAEDFVRLVGEAAVQHVNGTQARIEEARKHDWARRFEAVEAALAEVLRATA
ncbi:MAG: glycosyltransferase family 1 protein [Chloroflexi bacterium]|nr:glycosyltransferase family 1 protein [Chloroflexota bacterium]